MGVIKRQTIKGSIYSYLGIAIGFFYTILSIKLLTPEQIGLTAILGSVSAVYSQFATLGFNRVIERLFPYFYDKEKKHNGFLFITIAVGMIGFIISLIIFFILKPHMIDKDQKGASLFAEYIWYLIPLIFFRMYTVMLDTYNKMLLDATTGSILTDFIYRVGTILLLGLYFLKWISFSQFVLGFVFFLSMPALYLAILLIRRKQFNLEPKLEFIKPELKKEMINISAFGIIGGLSSVALKQIDTIMLNAYTDFAITGVYSIIFYFNTVIAIPGVALGKISSTIIANAWKEKDTATIADIYYKSSINQMFVSLLLFILVVANLQNIILLMGKDYAGTEWVMILISLSSLIVSSTGSSVQIIATSHKYRIQTYSLAFLVVLSVIFYMIFIPILGMEGAALGSLLSVSGASLLRVFYLKRNMNLFPYRLVHLKCAAIGLVALALGKLMPVVGNFYIDLIIRSSLVSVVFIGLCYIFHITEDMNQIVHKVFKRVKIIR
ncbi:MAG TPA: polysaccharide biosynthesis C-terminal domain-containing protein [Prolixibacteraceae bacterium]|nr:polysaccharide biosynthesis C-terminal domain-containing protein [Prolixibacteraceae bacterium]